jgi:hypothetical protein
VPQALARKLRDAVIVAAVTFVLAEGGVRALGYVAGDPLRSVIREAQRITLSNTRTYGGTRIQLPPSIDADIVAVGDSFPFGTYVRESDTFVSVLARDTGRTAVNLAVGSQDPSTYQRMVELAAAYRPSLLLYCVFANDFSYDGSVVPRTLSADVPFGGRPEDEALYVRDLSAGQRASSAARRITNLSRLYQIWKLFRQPAATHQAIRWERDGMSFLFASAAYWDPLIDWRDPAIHRAAALNAAFVNSARAFTSARNIGLLVVLIPSKEMVYGPLAGEAVYRDTHHQTYRELASRLRADGVAVLDLTDGLRARAQRGEQLYFTLDGHWNEAGHRAAAAEIMAYIDEVRAAAGSATFVSRLKRP